MPCEKISFNFCKYDICKKIKGLFSVHLIIDTQLLSIPIYIIKTENRKQIINVKKVYIF